MIKTLIYGTMLSAAVLFASCSGNQNNSGNNADNKTTETNTPAQKGTIEDVWRSYLTSEYLDIPAKNVEKAMSSLDKKGSNAAQVIFDDTTNEVLTVAEPDPNATEEEECNDSALGYYYETLALFDNKDGGQTVLLYSSRPGWGRNLVSIFSYSNGTLKRLPVSKLPFSDDMFNNEPNYDFEQGKISNVLGTEVQYLDPSLNIDPASFTKDGFDTESAGEHDRTFKWDGEKFTSIAG